MYACARLRNVWSERLRFFGRFVRGPRRIGAVLPSSRRLARAMVAGLECPPSVRVAELGPGTGAVTAEILSRLPASARYVGIDADPTFVAVLRARWPQLDCVQGRAEQLAALVAARDLFPLDHIVSGLPFASLPASTIQRVLGAIDHTLGAGGTFTTFQYLHAFCFQGAAAFRHGMTATMGTPPTTMLVVGNVPPAVVVRWRRATPDSTMSRAGHARRA